ncbi:UNVERIFIED_CONTAM: GATA transcription factor 1 [Sesamum calycinum]|uniref:GATA transcription factor 1 n=1 Tax=Sesamum calycinum TaxID=2727403 RepID=A0AAW2RA48_9LAMI
MEILDATAACFVVDDELLNFTLDGEGEDDEVTKTILKGCSASSSSSSLETTTTTFSHENRTGSFPEFVEEELEWLSNKDAFPALETCFGILADNPELVLSHQSPVSVLENSNSSSSSSHSNSSSKGNGIAVASCCGSLKVPAKFPVRARSKRRRRKRRAGFGEMPSQHCVWLDQVNIKKQESSFLLPPLSTMRTNGASMGRRCLHCQADKTHSGGQAPWGRKRSVMLVGCGINRAVCCQSIGPQVVRHSRASCTQILIGRLGFALEMVRILAVRSYFLVFVSEDLARRNDPNFRCHESGDVLVEFSVVRPLVEKFPLVKILACN